MNRSRCIPIAFLVILALALFPSTASANVGTPLMWASAFHLVIGNAIIGLIEGLLLARIFKCSKWKSILILVAANYTSAWVGGFLVTGPLASLPDITIQSVRVWFLIFILAAFLLTLLIEFPFFWFALRSRQRPLREALIATPVIHGISYALLMGWYWMASGTSMMTALTVVPAGDMEISEPYALYFLSREGSQVLCLDLHGSASARPVAEVPSSHHNDRLFVRARGESGFDLLVFLDSDVVGAEKESFILRDFSDHAPVDWRIAEGLIEKPEGTWHNFGPVPKVATESDWDFETGFWPVEGLTGVNEKSGKRARFSLELPFAPWPVRNATHISGDYVVAQLGEDQIFMIHRESRRIALIARGRGPVVAKPKMPDKAVVGTEGVTD